MSLFGRLLAIAAALLMSFSDVANAAEVGTPVSFESTATGRKEQIKGYLSFPSTSSKRYPLMLIMHASGGIHQRDWFFARTLNEMGVATFVLDSFGPRGLVKVSENKRSFGEREMSIDALTALEVLSDNPSLAGRFVPRELWRRQLDYLLARGLEGVVVWGSPTDDQGRPVAWNPNAWWWIETKAFLAALRQDPAIEGCDL